MTTNRKLRIAALAAASFNSFCLFAEPAIEAELRANPEEKEEAAGFGTPWTERESLFIQPLVEEAAPDLGFTPYVSWTGEQWSNFSGGIERGTTWNSLFTLGFEQDFSKLFKVDNLGYFGVSVFYNVNSSKSKALFDSLYSGPSNIHAGDMIRVFEIFYGNSFETDIGTFSIRIGQLAADEDFMGIDYADLFLNSNFGAIPTVAGGMLHGGDRMAFSQYAQGTLGMTLAYENNGFDAIFGVYNGDAGEDVSSNNGFDYDLEGVAFWYQFGYNYEIGGFAGRVQVGGNYHSGRFDNFRTGETERNYYSFFLGIQQEVVKSDEGDPILGLYARLAYAPDGDIVENNFYMEGGLNWFAPIPGRDDDVFGVGVSSMHMSGDIRAADAEITRYQTAIEATYRIQFTPAISLQPSFQVFFNPYNNDGERKTCFVGGARLEVLF